MQLLKSLWPFRYWYHLGRQDAFIAAEQEVYTTRVDAFKNMDYASALMILGEAAESIDARRRQEKSGR
jgi:hypothetical protein